MKEKFKDIAFRDDTLQRIATINGILAEYDGQALSVRQVYYRVVGTGAENTKKAYKNFVSLLSDARLAGLVDWNAIDDRVGVASMPSEIDDVNAVIDSFVEHFRFPRWFGQPYRVDVAVEKDALSGVLQPVCDRWHVPLVVNKGYSSLSAMKTWANRLILDGNDGENPTVVLYLGDHDPSGIDMVRDVGARLQLFGVRNLEVRKIALSIAQVRKYNLPPNPLKTKEGSSELSDSRAAGYVEEHGNESWELDAMPPKDLVKLVDKAISELVDQDLMDEVVAREVSERDRVRKAIRKGRSR